MIAPQPGNHASNLALLINIIFANYIKIIVVDFYIYNLDVYTFK
jgi:hypothetical protein